MKHKINNISFFIFKFLYSNKYIYIYILVFLFSFSIEFNCPEELPFFNRVYNNCVNFCSYNNILSSLCIPSSDNILSVEITLNIIEELLKNSTININKYEYTINGDNVTFQITSTELLKKYINMNNTYSNSYIDLGECENHLKLKNSLQLNDSLIIILINIINTTYITTYDKGFFIYEPNNKTKLDILDACDSFENILYFNVSVIPGNNTNRANFTIFNKKGINLANINDPFYTDVCKNHTFDYKTDIPLSYRKKEYKEYIFYICGENCTMINYDYRNNKIFCKCYTSYNNKIQAEGKGNIFNKAKLNFNVLQCYKKIIEIDFKKIYINIIFLLLSFLLLLFIILMLIYFIRKNKSFKEIIDNVMKNNKEVLRRITILEGRINKNNKEEDEKDNFKGKQMSYYLSRSDPSNLITRELKDSSRKFLIIQNESNINEKITKKINDNKLNNINKKNSRNKIETKKNFEYNYTTKKGNIYNTRVIYEKKVIYEEPETQHYNHNKKHKVKKDNFFINKIVENNNNNENDKSIIIEKSQNLNMNNEYNIVKKIDIIKKDERLFYYCDTEMNLFDYEKALEIDTRSLLRYYWSIIADNDIILYSFGLWNNDYNFSTVKISFFIFSFNLILSVNICFMTDKDIYHLFEAEGKYIFTYYILKNTLSMLICVVLILLMKYLIFGVNTIFSIRYFEKEEFEEKVKKLIKCIHIKNIIFFVISLIFIIFITYFVICFSLVYVNNEIVLISNALVTLAEIAFYPFILGILSVIFRYISLKDEKRNRHILYKFNQYYEFILL